MKTLIAVYSRTGATRRMAEQLAGRLGADLDDIVTARRTSFLGGILQSLRLAEPAVSTRRDPAAYDRVVVGAPVWAGRMAPPLRTYLRRNAGRFASLAAFCTSGSGQAYDRFFAEAEQITGRPLAARLSVSEAAARKTLPPAATPFIQALSSEAGAQAVRAKA